MSSAESVSYDADEWGQYRSLSSLAVIAFALGLCSVVVFASPLLIVVPLAAAAAGALALRNIATSDGGYSGARLAHFGIALALLFTTAAFARVKIRDGMLEKQADQVGRQWLALASAGRAEDMLELMTKDAADKMKPAAAPGQPMPFFGNILASALMRQDPAVVRLEELREGGELGFRLNDASVIAASKPVQGVFRYVVRSASGEEQLCALVLKRYRASQLEYVWLVDSWSLE